MSEHIFALDISLPAFRIVQPEMFSSRCSRNFKFVQQYLIIRLLSGIIAKLETISFLAASVVVRPRELDEKINAFSAIHVHYQRKERNIRCSVFFYFSTKKIASSFEFFRTFNLRILSSLFARFLFATLSIFSRS